MGAKFLSLDPITWEWKFQVDHFSKYGMPSAFDESEDNDGTTATVSGDFLPGEEKIGDENAAFEVNVSFAHPHPSQQIHRRPSPATVASPSFSSFPLSSPGASSSRTLYPHSSLPTAPPKRHSVVSLSSAAPSPKLRRAPPELSSFSAPFSFSASATSFASPPAVTIDESVPSFAPLTTSFPPPIPSPLIVPLGTSSTLPPYAKPLSASAVRNESRILGFPSHGPVDSFQSSRFCACLSLAANGLLVLPHAGGGVRGGGRTMITGISGGGPIGIVDPEFKTDAEGRGKGGGTETRTWLSLVKVTSLIAPIPQLENWDSGSLPMPLSRDEDEGVGKALEEYLQESRDGYVEDLSQRRDGGTNLLTSKNRHNRRGRQPPPAVIRQFGGGGPLTILPVPKAVDGTTIFVSRTVPCDVVHRVVKGFEDRLKEWKGLNVKPSVDAINGLIRYQRKLARENLAIFCGDVSPLIASDLKKRNQHLETYYLARYADETWALLSALFERRLSEGCFLSDGTEKCSGIPSDLQWLKGRRRGERGGGAEEDNGEDEEETEEEGRGSRAARVLRDVYLRLSGWLQSLNGRTIRAFLELPANPKCLKEGDEEEERMKVVFHLLSGLLVPEAVECLVGLQELFRGGGQSPIPGAYVFLASLITMTGSQTFQRIVIRQQLDHFDAVGFLNKIPLGVRRLYQLLSGYLSDLPSKESLDWKTTFALHWWFPDPVRDLQLEATPPPQALDGPRDLVRAMVQYERSFLRPGQSSVLPPLASYLRGVRGNPQEMGEGSIEEGELSLSNKLDLQFSLLK